MFSYLLYSFASDAVKHASRGMAAVCVLYARRKPPPEAYSAQRQTALKIFRCALYKSPQRWANQITNRKWTPDEISMTIKKGDKFDAPNRINPANTATRYQLGDRFVVRDDVTKEVIQISGNKFDPLKMPVSGKNYFLGGNGMNSGRITEVYVQLLDEGTPTARGTEAIDMGDGTYKLLATSNYDPEDETWEFLPGSIVRCEKTLSARNLEILLAVEKTS